jgi:pilus assembly protein Flp/PilA
MKALFGRLVREEAGQDLIEYALLAGLMGAALILLITSIGGKITTRFTTLDGNL